MKPLLKKLARSLWRISAPVRRPVIRKFDHHMIQLLGSCSPYADAPANLDLPLSSVVSELARLQIAPANLDLALSSVVRELARLQIQVELLQQQIDDLQSSGRHGARPESRLSVIGEIG
jgi:hypothetical protein